MDGVGAKAEADLPEAVSEYWQNRRPRAGRACWSSIASRPFRSERLGRSCHFLCRRYCCKQPRAACSYRTTRGSKAEASSEDGSRSRFRARGVSASVHIVANLRPIGRFGSHHRHRQEQWLLVQLNDRLPNRRLDVFRVNCGAAHDKEAEPEAEREVSQGRLLRHEISGSLAPGACRGFQISERGGHDRHIGASLRRCGDVAGSPPRLRPPFRLKLFPFSAA